MAASFLQAIFGLPGRAAGMLTTESGEGLCRGDLGDAVEYAVDELSSRLRAVSHYARVLRAPLASTFRYIDKVADAIPGSLLCCRSAFADDPRVNAFFVSPNHIQEVFSQSEEVRRLFDANPLAEECWALLCMHKVERRQPGMALINDEVRKDVLQTSVSFSDHQVVSPGADEASARCALKCCMFDGLLGYIRRHLLDVRTQTEDRDTRLRLLHNRLRRAETERQRETLTGEIEALERELREQTLQIRTVNDQLAFVAHALAHPAEYLSASERRLRLNRLGIKLETGSNDPGFDLRLSEIQIATHTPRIGALVRFPRDELLPQPDFLMQADMFLAV